MKLKTYLSTIIFLMMAVIVGNAQTEKSTDLPSEITPVDTSAQKKSVAPTFNLTALDGKKFESTSLRGTVVVLNFWFTGCPPCLVEMPKLNELTEKFKNDEVVFIAPTWDEASVLPDFLKKYPFKYNIVADAGNLIIETYGDGTGNVPMPTHIVIDKQGNIDTKIVGGLIKADGSTPGLDELTNAITRLAKKSPDETQKKTDGSK